MFSHAVANKIPGKFPANSIAWYLQNPQPDSYRDGAHSRLSLSYSQFLHINPRSLTIQGSFFTIFESLF
jgi:hypothetical protein